MQMPCNPSHRMLASLMLTSCISACAAPQAPREHTVLVYEVDKVAAMRDTVLTYDARLDDMDSSGLTAEQLRLQSGPGNPATTLELALVLARGHDPHDLARAIGLLQGMLADNSTEAKALQPLARLLLPSWQERQNQARDFQDQLSKQSQLLHEAQKREDQTNEKLVQANQKLEALKAIENTLQTPAAMSAAPSGRSNAP